MGENTERLTLRDLSLPMRLVVAAFLVSVGLGYIAALVQLKVQLASPGEIKPTSSDVISAYHGKSQISQLQRLLEADESQPFNGQGSMRTAFTRRSGGLKRAIKEKAKELAEKNDGKEPNLAEVEKLVRQERNGERLALIDWIKQGAEKEAYEKDKHPLNGNLTKLVVTESYVTEENGQRYVAIKTILQDRCARCHSKDVGGPGSHFPLDTYEDVTLYVQKEAPTGMSLPKLAQTTHVHLLGFSMLWGLTGLIFAFTSYPFLLRLILAPLPLIAQIADISCWWLSRLDAQGAQFARTIEITGGIVAAGVFLQILLTLFNLFGKSGKLVVLALIIGGALGLGGLYQKVIDPYLQHERQEAVAPQSATQ